MEGESMNVVPLSKTETVSPDETSCARKETSNLMGIAAGGALLAGGVLLLTGYRRAGTVAAASGAALTMIDQQELVKTWWNQLPGYIDQIENLLKQAQGTIEQVQEMVDNLAAKREKVLTLLHR
jgi:hypothetical protein